MKKPPLTTALTLTILLTLTGSVSAKLRDYKLYKCSAIDQAYQCSVGCLPERVDVRFEFLVSSEKGMVMTSAYRDGKLIGSSTVEECKVFDEKNWDCSSRSENSMGTAYTSYINKMVNGLHVGGREVTFLNEARTVSYDAACLKP